MSPSEFDLRAALHDGEGDAANDLNVEAVITGGRLQAARRRTQLLSGAAGFVLVAGVVTTGAVIWGTSGGSNDQTSGSAKNALRGAAPTYGVAAGAGESAAMSVPSASASRASSSAADAAASSASAANKAPVPARPSLACPTSVPTTALPSGTSATSGALFAKPVQSVFVCAYRSAAATPSPTSTVLTGAQARTLVASMEHARTTRVPGLCPAIVRLDARQLAIIAMATDGTRLPTVAATLNQPACRSWVSNGTAVRYGWIPPAALAAQLQSLATGNAPIARPSDVPNNGSPIHS